MSPAQAVADLGRATCWSATRTGQRGVTGLAPRDQQLGDHRVDHVPSTGLAPPSETWPHTPEITVPRCCW